MTPGPSRRAVLSAGGLLLAGAAACDSGSSSNPPGSASSTVSAATPPASPSRSVASATGAVTPRGPAPEVVHGPRTRAEVALTLHGAGDPTIARALLTAADRAGVKITMMAVGTWLADNRAFARDLLAAGHEIGNHTWTHPVMSNLAEPQVRDEIKRCRDLVLDVTGGILGQFRHSSGARTTPTSRAVAGSLGYTQCLSYDVDALDWTDPGPDVVRAECAKAQNGSIVSLHFGHQVTVAALPKVIDDLRARGLQMVTASQLLRP